MRLPFIHRSISPKPTLKSLFFWFIFPYAGLLDSLIGILSFSLLCGTFQTRVTCELINSRIEYNNKQQEQNK